MPHPLIIFSQSNCFIRIVDINSHTKWQTVQLQISCLLQEPSDLDLHCLQRQGIPGSAWEGLSELKFLRYGNGFNDPKETKQPSPHYEPVHSVKTKFTLCFHTGWSGLLLSFTKMFHIETVYLPKVFGQTDLCKECRSTSAAIIYGIRSESPLFATCPAVF